MPFIVHLDAGSTPVQMEKKPDVLSLWHLTIIQCGFVESKVRSYTFLASISY